MPKKVVIITPAYPLRGGIAASGERLAQAFQEQGYEVIIYSFSLQYPNFLFPGKTQFSSDPAPAHLTIKTIISSINPFNWLLSGRAIAREKADIVICRFWMPFFGPCLGTIARIVRWNKVSKIIGWVDNIIPHEHRMGDRPLAEYFTNACDSFVVMSRSVKDEMKQFSAQPCIFTPHPIYDIYGEKVSRTEGCDFLQLADNQRYILFFGFIRRYKGLDLLLEAFHLFKQNENTDDIKLIVAGEFYDDEKFYTELIQKLDLENEVIIKSDFIPSEEVRYYFGASDMVVQPYRTATQSGISQIAYHFEKPMLVSNVGGLPEIVPQGEAGYVVEPQAQPIADALLDFYKNDKIHQFTEGVVRQKKRFSWDVMVEAFLSANKK